MLKKKLTLPFFLQDKIMTQGGQADTYVGIFDTKTLAINDSQ